jgi:hypothetical protein
MAVDNLFTDDLKGIIDFYKKKSSPIVALYDVKKTSLAKHYVTVCLIKIILYNSLFFYHNDMGYVKIKATIGSPDNARLMDVEFLAGSWYMVLTPSIVKELKLSPVATRRLGLG